MATHDYIISNASGAAVRADLNNALAAIASNNSSATAPTTTYAYQWWADTGSSPTVMKLRNAANSAWITLFQLDGEWSLIPFENGTAAAPSIYFKDSGTDTGIYSPGADQVAITTGGTARLYVGSTGAVGIGTTSPGATLDVVGNARAQGSSSSGGLFDAVYSGTSTGNQLGAVRFYGTGAGVTAESQIRSSLDSGVLTASNLTFSVSSGGSLSEAARIDSSRRLLVGTSSVSGSNYSANLVLSKNSGTTRWEVGPYSTATAFIIAADQTNGVYLSSTSATSWSSASDERIKTDLEPIQNGLEKVGTLRAVTGRFISDKEEPRKAFLIAQDVLAVLPEAVDTSNSERYGLAYTEVIPLLVAALKESKERIEQLEAKVAALENA